MEITLKTKWNYQQYLKLNDDKQYQVIKGELIMNPAPSSKHQFAASNLGYQILDFVKKGKTGQVLFAPYDVILNENNIVQPDILYISNNKLEHVKERGLFGTPDLVVEIISPSSLKRDTEDKREIYREFGIKEYWLVFPLEETIEVLELTEGKYKIYDYAFTEDTDKEPKVKSKLLNGLEIDLREIF